MAAHRPSYGLFALRSLDAVVSFSRAERAPLLCRGWLEDKLYPDARGFRFENVAGLILSKFGQCTFKHSECVFTPGLRPFVQDRTDKRFAIFS